MANSWPCKRDQYEGAHALRAVDQIIGPCPDFSHVVGLFDRVEIVANVVDTSARGSHDIVEPGEIAHEQGFGGGAVGVEPAFAIGWPQQVWSRG